MSAKSGPRKGEMVKVKDFDWSHGQGEGGRPMRTRLLNKNKEVLGVMKLLGRMENGRSEPREQSLPGTDGRSGWLEMEKTHNHLGSGRDLLRPGPGLVCTGGWFRH